MIFNKKSFYQLLTLSLCDSSLTNSIHKLENCLKSYSEAKVSSASPRGPSNISGIKSIGDNV